MDSVVTTITPAQADILRQMVNAKQYPDAYRYLRDIVEADPNGEAATASWLDKAASINEEDGSLISDFIIQPIIATLLIFSLQKIKSATFFCDTHSILL